VIILDFIQVLNNISENIIIEKTLWSILVILIIILVSRLLKNVFYKVIKDRKKYYGIKRTINYITGGFIVIYLIFIWLDSGKSLTTYIGLLSAGIAISLKEIFTNIAGWMFIEVRKPFDVGHRIMIGNQKGDVIDKRLFQFTIMELSSLEDGEQSTGRIIDIPNSYVLVHPTVNYSKGFEYIWNEIKVIVTFDSNWKKTKELILDIVSKETDLITKIVSDQISDASRKYMIHYNKLTPIVYTDVKDSGIQLSVRYLCEPKQRRITVNKIWEDILEMISENKDIELAYPTKRVVS
jgi:small-conductance mechanosensitive channel